MESNLTQCVYLGADHVVSSLGEGTEQNASRILNYDTGIQLVDDPALWPEPFCAARIPEEDRTGERTGSTRLEALFSKVIEAVLARADIDPTDVQLQVIISSTKGNIELLGQDGSLTPELYLTEMANRIGAGFLFKKEIQVISNACISGVSSLIIGQRLIRDRQCRHVLIVGGDVISRFIVTGFQSFHSISDIACRPFDRNRDGLSLGEACAGVLLTADKDKALHPVLELKGGGISNDANHISGPSRTGDGLAIAIERAIAESGLKKEDISFINAHGTATLFNDEMESKAILLSQLEAVPVNSLKPYLGHTLGASGVIETILDAWQLRNSCLFATKGYEACGVPVPLSVSSSHIRTPMRNALKLASGFGGCNAALILGYSGEEFKKHAFDSTAQIHEIRRCRVANEEIPFADFIRQQYKEDAVPNMKFFKMDDLCKLGYIAAQKLLHASDETAFMPSETALILVNKSASLDTDMRHQNLIDGEAGASPAVFVYTLPNIVAGEIAIRHKIQGETTFFIAEEPEGYPYRYACSLLHTGVAKRVLFGWCDYLNGQGVAELRILTL